MTRRRQRPLNPLHGSFSVDHGRASQMVFWQDARFAKRRFGDANTAHGRPGGALLACCWRCCYWLCSAPGCSARQPAPARRHAQRAPAGGAGDGRARCQRRAHHQRRQPPRPGVCHRLRAWPGALLPDGPAAPQRRRRAGRAVRAARLAARPRAPPAPLPRPRRIGAGALARTNAPSSSAMRPASTTAWERCMRGPSNTR
jgi:hypothetical protein